MPANRRARRERAATKAAGSGGAKGFTAEERAAMRERARELRTAARRGPRASQQDGERDVVAKIASFQESDRVMGDRIHALVKAHAPALAPRLWYGMPAYAKDGQVVCFFRDARKFGTRYATLGFSDEAKLDDGNMWPTDFALKELTAAEEAMIASLLRRAVG